MLTASPSGCYGERVNKFVFACALVGLVASGCGGAAATPQKTADAGAQANAPCATETALYTAHDAEVQFGSSWERTGTLAVPNDKHACVYTLMNASLHQITIGVSSASPELRYEQLKKRFKNQSSSNVVEIPKIGDGAFFISFKSPRLPTVFVFYKGQSLVNLQCDLPCKAADFSKMGQTMAARL